MASFLLIVSSRQKTQGHSSLRRHASMTSLDSGAQVDDQSVNMEDVSVPILTDEDKCTKLTSLEKQYRILSARRDYVAEMIEIENAIPSNTSEITQPLEEEAANLDEKIKNLEDDWRVSFYSKGKKIEQPERKNLVKERKRVYARGEQTFPGYGLLRLFLRKVALNRYGIKAIRSD
ncbi:hypothetical protein TNCT_328381 [Trichonephila clavata]|uniref:Uncharacterized protein n=1 Tax=Trichonephila clavata TaxID=2740835 RepID=A0A8X6JT47_TRICU|nr:hypothetical protein TNCT_328381 [Trichonephila clavata]